MDSATRALLANLAASFLLLVVFALLSMLAVALFMLWRGLGAAGPELRRLVAELEAPIRRSEAVVRRATRAVVEPPIRLASTWVGVRVALHALMAPSPPDRTEEPRPPL